MKFNKWTLGLAAVGVVSLASAAKADEKLSVVQTALSSTTISGYVDTAAHWNPGSSTGVAYYGYGGVAKSDGFNLNVVQLSISKPLDESEWASGYKVDLWFGPDANTLGAVSGGTSADLAIKQAYVALRTPVGNGIDWKMGVFDTIIGYESSESPNNPNYTRSYGYTIEPTTHTGLLGTYRFCDEISMSAGIANTFGPTINGRAFATTPPTPPPNSNITPDSTQSYKTYMVSAALTAPQSWGWAAGSTLYGGLINGFSAGSGVFAAANTAGKQSSYYVGATVATPVTGLKVGAAFDYLDSRSSDDPASLYQTGNDYWAAAIYTSYQATEKLSLHLRGELATSQNGTLPGNDNTQIWALTGTVQYDLWQNVISRLEIRWDHSDETDLFVGSAGTINLRNSVLIAANLIYKF
jgi:hypothetical protein